MSTENSFWGKVFIVGKHLEIKEKTLIKWRQRGSVPAKWRIPIFEKAPSIGQSFTLSELQEAQP